jgi:uncharacterized membrane protein YraQ (UPF0718 family)
MNFLICLGFIMAAFIAGAILMFIFKDKIVKFFSKS